MNMLCGHLKHQSFDMLKTFFAAEENTRKEFEKLFVKISQEGEMIKKLITGIGDKLAVTILAVVIDSKRFENKHQYHAYSGLVKHIKQSGGRNYGSRNARFNRTLKLYIAKSVMRVFQKSLHVLTFGNSATNSNRSLR